MSINLNIDPSWTTTDENTSSNEKVVLNFDAIRMNDIANEKVVLNFDAIRINDLTNDIKYDTNNGANLMNATDYQRMDHRDQIYKEADMYLGGLSRQTEYIKVLDFTDQANPKFIDVSMDFPDGAKRVILEPLYNATDNVDESRKRKHPVGEIDIKMDNKFITIRNGGVPIPITIHEIEKIWTPQLIFSTLLTSGQYKKTVRTGSGKNGYGSKLTNIFSKWMRIKIGNPYDKKYYEQLYEHNMVIIHPPTITDYSGEPFVEISFLMDFARFGYTEYPATVISWLAAVAVELAFTVKVPVTFNGYRFEVNDVLQFKNYTQHTTNNYIVHYEYPEGTELKNKRMPNGTTTKVAVNDKIMPIVELCLIDSPDCNEIFAFANSANTREGGVHVEQVYDAGTDFIIAIVNNSIKSKKDDKLTRKQALNKSDLKRHMSIILSCSLENPLFTSQEKIKLSSPKPKIKIDEANLKKISNWELALRLQSDLMAKLDKNNKGTKGKKFLTADGYSKAYYAGKKGESHKCVLYEVEGLSAMSYAYAMKSAMPEEQRSYVGLFAQMGKPMNVRTAKLLKLMESSKYQRFIEALNLDPIKDPDYTIEKNFLTLNYGCLALLNDSDVDGKHISALVLNIIYCRYRSLLRRNFIVMVRTPIIRITKGKQVFKFYSQAEYKKFINENPQCKNWETKYYKGLGSSDKEEAKDETANPRIVYMIYDDTADQYFDLAFSREAGQTDKRKEWISKFELLEGIEEIKMLPISQFLNHELLQHAQWSMARTIPRFDGLKNVQRKIVFGMFDEWGAGIGTTKRQVKTQHLSSHVSKTADYIHGEASMVASINTMVLSYPGSNNMRFFVPKGMFGTRNKAGDDAGESRYTFLYPEWWLSYIFRSEDKPILTMVDRDGGVWEPEFYLPILPIHMINGCLGIGTGSSTFIPNFNPVDLYNSIISILAGVKFDPLIPWYRGFKGKIEVCKRNAELKIEGEIYNFDNIKLVVPPEVEEKEKDIGFQINLTEDDDDDEEEIIVEKLEDLKTDKDGNIKGQKKKIGGLKMITYGIFKELPRGDIFVSEIPIGKSFDQYKETLEAMKEKKEIKDYKEDCVDDDARFTIYGFKGNPNYDSLGLVKGYSLTNMVLLDEKDRRCKFETPNELLEKWVEQRLPFYQKRKDNQLKQFLVEIADKQDKIKFIHSVIDGVENGYIPGRNIVIMKNKKDLVYAQMDALGIDRKHLKGTSSDKYTVEDIANLNDEVDKLKEKYNQLYQLTIDQMFINDLNEFIGKYLREYPDEKVRLNKY